MQSLKKYIHILWSGVPPLRSLSKEIILHFHKENSTLYNKASTWDSLNVYQLGTGSKWCSVQYGSVSHVWLFVTPWTAAHQASLSITNSQSLLRLMSIESVMPSNHLILCHPLLLLPSFFPTIRIFSNESVLHIRWPKYWSFSFSISSSNVYSGLISFRTDWLYHLAVQGTLKSLPQQHSSKASIFQCSAFFMAQLSHTYWKDHSLDKVTFVSKSNICTF